MNWAAIQAVAEAIGAIVVVASLIYLAIQVRQNTRAVRVATYDGMVQASGDFRWQRAYSEPFQAFLEGASAPGPDRQIVTTEAAARAEGLRIGPGD